MPAAAASLTMASILLVEDEITLRDLVAYFLSDFGHQVALAANGVEALHQLEASEFDVVVSDISMPEGISGIDLAEQLRERHPRTKVILVSGFARAQLRPLPAGVSFLPKPYRIHQLLELLPLGEPG
jgi:two-component system, cell cycle response regulator CpdR